MTNTTSRHRGRDVLQSCYLNSLFPVMWTKHTSLELAICFNIKLTPLFLCGEKIAAGSKQCGAESSGQPVERCDQPEEQCTMDYGRMDQVTSNKNQILDKNTENSKNTKVLHLHKP